MARTKKREAQPEAPSRRAAPTKKFRWKPGSRFVADPQAVGERIEQLLERLDRPLQRSDVYEDARDPSSPLHSEIFGNSDEEAAESWRLELAGRVLRSISFVVTTQRDGKDVVLTPPVVVMVPGAGFQLTERVFDDEELVRSVFSRLLDDLRALKRKFTRYEGYRELGQIMEALGRIEEKVERGSLDD